ncbi:uncharacterized protein TNCV_679511 [Trichonephila clavipes]|nr:uncharacterized protein TNCV_679511 [Trichonephila clavipes]
MSHILILTIFVNTGAPSTRLSSVSRNLNFGPICLYQLNHQATPIKSSLSLRWLSIVYYSSDEAHFWLNGYVNKQNCRIWSEANPQVYVETSLHREKLTVWCALWAGGILLQKR